MFAFHEFPFCPKGTTLVKHFLPADIVTMAPKKSASKETTKSSIREVVEQAPVVLRVYVDTQLFREKESTLTGQHVNESPSTRDLEADLEDTLEATPIESNNPIQDKGKRKVVDSLGGEQSCNMK